MDVHVTVRKWGNSLGIVLPSEIVEKLDILTGEELVIKEIQKTVPLANLFGIAKNKLKRSTQELKNEMREGWGD